MPVAESKISFRSGDLSLEGVLHLPNNSGSWPGVVVCHPHPQRGGDMNSPVVVAMARALPKAGIAALRFNFRGAGNSEGSHDRGAGEVDDAAAAVSFLTLHNRVRAGGVGIAGYSFGAWMALEVAAQEGLVQAVASVACPTVPFNALGAVEMLPPKLLVCGDADHDFPVGQFAFLAKRYTDPKQVEILHGADHFFLDHANDVAGMTADFFAGWLDPDARGTS